MNATNAGTRWPAWCAGGPHAALAVAVMLLVAVRPHAACMILLPYVIIGWRLLVFVAPAHQASDLVRRHVRPAGRERTAAFLTITAWIANLLSPGIAVVRTAAIAQR